MNGYRTPNVTDSELNSKDQRITATGIWERHGFAKVRHTAAGSIVAEAALAHAACTEMKAASIVLLHLSPPGGVVSEARTPCGIGLGSFRASPARRSLALSTDFQVDCPGS